MRQVATGSDVDIMVVTGATDPPPSLEISLQDVLLELPIYPGMS